MTALRHELEFARQNGETEMRKLAACAILLAVLTAGCASSDYMTDRWRDTLDMGTLTYNSSLGVRGRVGPLGGGLYAGIELGGLRGGECKKIDTDDGYGLVSDMDLTLFAAETFAPKNFTIARARGKLYKAKGVLTITPLVEMQGEDHSWLRHLPYYTDAQVALGLLIGVRMGFNTGELVDWLLGWCMIDIFDDDIGRSDPYAQMARRYREAMLKQQAGPQGQQQPQQPQPQPTPSAPQAPAPRPTPRPAPQTMPQRPAPAPQAMPQPMAPRRPAPQTMPQPPASRPQTPAPQAMPQRPAPAPAPSRQQPAPQELAPLLPDPSLGGQ